MSADDIQQVLLAGSFGAYLSPASAVRIGLVPRMALPRHRVGGQRGGGGGEDGRPERARARRGALDRPRGHVRRAVRADGLQRPLHRPARLPGMTGGSASSPAGRSRSTSARSPAGAAGTSTCIPCRRCCTTGPPDRPGGGGGGRVARPLDYDALAGAYADCGTYGALDEVLAGHSGVRRLRRGPLLRRVRARHVRAALDEEPGTDLTDFLARTFEHTVVREWASTATRSCATTTSATTRACCGWRSADAGDARGGGARGGADRPAARGARGRARGARARARAAHGAHRAQRRAVTR